MKPSPPGYPRSSDYIGFGYYSLTWVCYQRQMLFTQLDAVNLVWSQFLRASAETDVVTVAYTFMPDHVHQLVKGRVIMWLQQIGRRSWCSCSRVA